ncbi:MAG: fatty acid desaturase family protein [Gammaproteobacteria bacterium]|nr:fatty acid desaturase family protein [Gammaproteobacteria bacterium]
MPDSVQTPITQAMNEGALTRKELKHLMQRSDRPGLIRLVIWFALLGLTSAFVYWSLGTWWQAFAMFVHGIVLVHHFSLQHECCHYTAFRTRWLNDLVGNVCGLVIMLPNRFFRYEHCDHHTYTQVQGKDTEMIELPKSLRGYLWYLSSVPYWQAKLSEIWRHSRGRISSDDKKFVPREEYQTVIIEARLMVLFYVLVLTISIGFQSLDALWFWLLPVLMGEPVMRAIRMTEHVGRPMVHDMKANTRSNAVSLPWRFLCWNMNYHAEHHYASSVPFFALPELHSKLNGYIHIEPSGYLGAHRDILSQLTGRKPRQDSPTQV